MEKSRLSEIESIQKELDLKTKKYLEAKERDEFLAVLKPILQEINLLKDRLEVLKAKVD